MRSLNTRHVVGQPNQIDSLIHRKAAVCTTASSSSAVTKHRRKSLVRDAILKFSEMSTQVKNPPPLTPKIASESDGGSDPPVPSSHQLGKGGSNTPNPIEDRKPPPPEKWSASHPPKSDPPPKGGPQRPKTISNLNLKKKKKNNYHPPKTKNHPSYQHHPLKKDCQKKIKQTTPQKVTQKKI